MANKITVFVNRYSGKNPIAQGCISSFCEGLKKLGVRFSVAYEDEYEKNPCDIAVIFGAYKKILKTYGIRKKIFYNQKIGGKKVLVLERGFIKRDIYHSIGWDFINNRADFRNSGMPGDRVKALGVKMDEWRQDGENIVFCGQVPWDVSVQHINPEPMKRVPQKVLVKGYLKWCTDTVKKIQNITDRNIIFRPHPLFPYKDWHKDGMPKNIVFSNSTFEEDLENAWCTVVFNSNCSVDSVIKGVPTFAFDKGCMAWDVANKNINDIERPIMPERVQWLNNISYSQWSLEEFSNGIPWSHITRSN